MNYRKFGNTELLVSEIGFGSWAIGGGTMVGSTPIGWGDSNDSISKKAIFKSLDSGINFFDTADIYGLGHSEELIGNTIGNNQKVIIASKVGNVARNGIFTTDYSKKHILKSCDDSLRRLKRDVIDYYQLHSAKLPELQNGECIEAMEQLKGRGKIKYWGLSLNTFDPFPEAIYLMDSGKGSGFQLVLNIINQSALVLIKKASSYGYGVITRMPLQFGLLSGKFDTYKDFAINDHRKKRLTAEVIEAYKNIINPIWQLCKKYEITKAQLALSYILSHKNISTTIVGIRTAQQAEENTSGIKYLESEDISVIENTNFSKLLSLIHQQK